MLFFLAWKDGISDRLMEPINATFSHYVNDIVLIFGTQFQNTLQLIHVFYQYDLQ